MSRRRGLGKAHWRVVTGGIVAMYTEYARMQDVVFKTYGTKLDMLMDCVRRARPEKNKAAVRRSVFSLCLQSEEDRILQAMEAYYATQGYEVHVLIYDGCLVSRKDDKPFPEEVMRGCEEAVQKATRSPTTAPMCPPPDGIDA